MSFTERFNAALDALEISDAAFARAVGVSRATVHDWRTGETKTIKSENLFVVAHELNVMPRWLQSGVEPMRPPTAEQRVLPYESMRKVPLISWARAGQWSDVVDHFPPGAADQWVDAPSSVGRHAFGLRVIGDSMAPTLTEGSVVVFDPDKEAMHGRIVLAKRTSDQSATIKRLWYDGDTPWLKPDNERYPLMPMTDDTRIIGVAISVFREL